MPTRQGTARSREQYTHPTRERDGYAPREHSAYTAHESDAHAARERDSYAAHESDTHAMRERAAEQPHARTQARAGRQAAASPNGRTGRQPRTRVQTDPSQQSTVRPESRGDEQPSRQRATRSDNATRQRTRARSEVHRRQARPSKSRNRNNSTKRQRSAPHRRFSIPTISSPRLPVLPIAAAAGVILLVCLFVFLITPRCSADNAAWGSFEAIRPFDRASVPHHGEAESGPDENALTELLGEEEAQKLLDQAETNTDAYWIASHVDSFAFDGWEVQWKILKLAADEPESLKYVRDFAEIYPQETASTDASIGMDDSYLAGTKFDTNVPHFYQWDRRWGNIVYSSTTFGLTGCGPTSFAMVYQGVTGKTDMTPYDMAMLAENNGYMSEFQGTSTMLFVNEAWGLGMYCNVMDYVNADAIRYSLETGHVIIANLGPGYFTQNGHFFVLVGVDENGDIIINDPYSVARSTQAWDADLIASESIGLYEFSAI